ncbi:MAG: polyphosphate polymerase domain-containing protein [Bacilli bacterium]|nr:polyphosphate polymerase domain-containing protein [Bacilli bacterium]
MYENVFKRVEKKYLLSEEQRKLLFEKINQNLVKDKYYKSTICNIYFDTINDDLIINSLEKPKFKEKVRLRSYKVPTLEDEVFLEIKAKFKGVVGKRRLKMSLESFYDYLEKNEYDKNLQIMKEINYYFEYYSLKPAIFIAYDRISYRGCDDDNLRITLDSNLRSRYDNLRLEDGDMGEKYFDKKTYIMEIKTLGAMPLWLVRSLSELKIYPTSFSKYGRIHEKKIEKERLEYAK